MIRLFSRMFFPSNVIIHSVILFVLKASALSNGISVKGIFDFTRYIPETILPVTDIMQDIGEPFEESFRQFPNEEWNFPEGSPIMSQNFLESNNQWHAINPPPIDPHESNERISFKPPGRNSFLNEI